MLPRDSVPASVTEVCEISPVKSLTAVEKLVSLLRVSVTVLDSWQCWAVFSFSEVSDSCILKVSDSWLDTIYLEMIAPSQEPLEGLALAMVEVVLKQLLNHCSIQLSLLRSPRSVSHFICYSLNWVTIVIQALLSLHFNSPGVKWR